jgi:hypothetical protein
MATTLYASFPDTSLAEKATGALLDYGMKNEDISLVYGHHDDADQGDKGGAAGATLTPGSERVGSSSYESYGGAQVRTVEIGDAEPRPAVGGLGATATSYGSSTPGDIPITRRDASDMDADTDDDRLSAKGGISTTTPEDAEAGAMKGAGFGLAAGVLAGLASLMVPPVGLVLGGGALATAIGGAAGATVAGAVAGGAMGYLKDQGVDEEYAAQYDKAIQGGGAILAIHLPSGDVDDATAREVLGKYGAQNIHAGTAM